MAKDKKQPPLSYHELKMSGRLGSETIETFIDIASAISLGREIVRWQVMPIENVFLYDVEHRDTGEQRYLGKSYGNVPVYETTRKKLNARPVVGSLALTGINIDQLGTKRATFIAYGIPGISSLDIDQFNKGQSVVKDVLSENNIIQVFGEVTGRAVDFGDPTPHQPPNQDYDDLVPIGTFLDNRFDEHGKAISLPPHRK